MSIGARAARARLILEMKSRGYEEQEIAEEVGLNTRQVRKIWARERDRPDLITQDPVTIVQEVLEGYQRDMHVFSTIVLEAAQNENTSGMISALNGRAITQDKIIRLLQAMGRLPREMGTLRHVIDFRGIAQEMVRVLEAVTEGEKTPEEALAYFTEMMDLGAGTPQLMEAEVIEEDVEDEG